jgi:hypothetical protein
MTTRLRSPRAAAVVVLVLAAAVGGGVADAAGHKIGKNLVVTKSIKNGAVTGAKVKDGSLTAADLAPGTLPVVPPAASGKSVVMASRNDSPTAGNTLSYMQPVGHSASTDALYAVVPVAMEVADLHVVTPSEGIGQALLVQLLTTTSVGGPTTTVLSCTVNAQTSSCSADATGNVPAGTLLTIRTTAGPGGSAGGFVSVGYTVRVP